MNTVIIDENAKLWSFPKVEQKAQDIPTTNKFCANDFMHHAHNEEMLELLEQAKQQGFAAGFKKGAEESANELNVEMKAKIRAQSMAVEKILMALNHPLAVLENNLEQQILELVIKISKHLFRHEISLKPEQILNIVKEAKSLLPLEVKDVKVLVNSEDLQLIRQLLADESSDDISAILQADESLQRGDCKIKSDIVQIDATLDSRLDAMIEEVLNND